MTCVKVLLLLFQLSILIHNLKDKQKQSLVIVMFVYLQILFLVREYDDNLSGDDVCECLTAIVSNKHTDPQFEGQTKTKLGNSDVRTVTDSVFSEAFSKFLFENPATGKIIVEKGLMAARARLA